MPEGAGGQAPGSPEVHLGDVARAVVGGLLVSTVLSLFILPIMYTLLVKEEDVVKREAELEAELADQPIAPPNMAAGGGRFWHSEV